jgi:hypothetical protein
VPNVGMVISKPAGLFCNGFGNFGSAVSNIDAVQPGEGVQQSATVTVLDVDPLAPGHDPVRAIASPVLGKMG